MVHVEAAGMALNNFSQKRNRIPDISVYGTNKIQDFIYPGYSVQNLGMRT